MRNIKKYISKILTKLRSISIKLRGNNLEKFYKDKIIKYYCGTSCNLSTEQDEIIEYLKKNPTSLFPYEFTNKYKSNDVKIYYDDNKKLKYALWENKKLYFKKSCTDEIARTLFSTLQLVQDVKSPHRYITDTFNVSKNDIVADIGSAEGDFSLSIVEKVKKIYLFESDPELIEALQATFEPWNEKVTIINKFVSDRVSKKNTTIDSYFKNIEKPNFIKIDVEGSEFDLLSGAKIFLSSKEPLKIILASYHKHNDEVILRDILKKYDFRTEYSNGYMLSIWDNIIKEPYFRRGLIRASR